jgi:hypothetical protein
VVYPLFAVNWGVHLVVSRLVPLNSSSKVQLQAPCILSGWVFWQLASEGAGAPELAADTEPEDNTKSDDAARRGLRTAASKTRARKTTDSMATFPLPSGRSTDASR